MNFLQNEPLSEHSNFKIGGNASYFITVSSTQELKDALSTWKNISKENKSDESKVFIMGGGTNILFSDEGFKGLVIKVSIKGIEEKENFVRVGGGEDFSSLLDFCIENSLSGLEWAGGLPGTVGGAVRGNAGAFGGETKDRIKEVESLDLDSQELTLKSKDESQFSYRQSFYKKNGKHVITNIIFDLSKGESDEIEKLINEKKHYREEKHPLEYPNLGSIFKNVPLENFSDSYKNELKDYIKNDPFPVIPTAKLIFLAGLKGKKIGNVMVSEKHTNFIINLGGGKSSEVKTLISEIKDEIFKKFEIKLEEEIMFLGP